VAWQINRDVGEVDWLTPGTVAGMTMVEDFIEHRLKIFDDKRNDPTVAALSNLSPYVHFGQLSVASVVLRLTELKRHHASVQVGAPLLDPDRRWQHRDLTRPVACPPVLSRRTSRRGSCGGSCPITIASTSPSTTPSRARRAGHGRRSRCTGETARLPTSLVDMRLTGGPFHSADPREHLYDLKALEEAK
jgi:hypothetical protein